MIKNLAVDITAGAALLAVFGTGLGMLIRITRRWTAIELNLQSLVDKFTEAMQSIRSDYQRLERRVDRNEGRIDRHEEWHTIQERDSGAD